MSHFHSIFAHLIYATRLYKNEHQASSSCGIPTYFLREKRETMAEQSIIHGKTVALTGTFSKMKRAEVSAEIEKLGGIVAKSLTRKCDILIYGERAGSKLNQAQSMGVELYNEDGLIALLQGKDFDAEQKQNGPLSDYMDRVEKRVAELRADPRIFVRYYRAPGVSSTTLQKMAKNWDVDAWSESIQNFYRQANGFMLCWFAQQHPDWKQYKDSIRLSETSFPTSYQMENLPWELGGMIWLLPIEDALNPKAGYINFAYDVLDPQTERQLCGRSFRGEELERSIRVFEYAIHYYPIGFLSGKGISDPFVLCGDDYGACWEGSSVTNFEGYLENLLSSYGRIDARRSLGEDISFDLEAFLPKVKGQEVEHTFSVRIISVEQLDAQEVRARRIASEHGLHFKKAAKLLNIGERSSRSTLEVCRDIAEATSDMKALDAALVRKIGSALLTKERSKKAMSRSLFCHVVDGGLHVELEVKTLFNATSQKKYHAEHDAICAAQTLFDEHEIYLSLATKSTGRKTRISHVSLTLPGNADAHVDDTFELRILPSGFIEQDGAFVWDA